MKISKEKAERLDNDYSQFVNSEGKETLDPVPLELAPGIHPPTMLEQIRRMVTYVSEEAGSQGYGTFDEEDDFVDDEFPDEPLSGHEIDDLEPDPEMMSSADLDADDLARHGAKGEPSPDKNGEGDPEKKEKAKE